MAERPLINMRFPPDLLERVDEEAKRRGKKRSEWVIEACEAALRAIELKDVVGKMTIDTLKSEEAQQKIDERIDEVVDEYVRKHMTEIISGMLERTKK